MTCLSSISDNKIVLGFVDGNFIKSSSQTFLGSLPQTPLEVWDRRQTMCPRGTLDLKDIAVLLKKPEFVNTATDAKSRNLTTYLDIKNRTEKYLKSYKRLRVNTDPFSIFELIPGPLYRDLIEAKTLVLDDVYNFYLSLPYFNRIEKFFRTDITRCLEALSYSIKTADGDSQVNLNFAQNFRFKAKQGTLNIFNMAKELRDNIIAQEPDHFIYCADFRQFEFRTFLMIHPMAANINFEDLAMYDTVGQRHGVTKQQILAYLFGEHNSNLAEAFPVGPLLEKAQNDVFFWRYFPVVLQQNVANNKNVHTIIQTISQYVYLEKLNKVLDLLNGKSTKFLYPFHDNMIFSMHKNETDLIPQIQKLLEDDVYKVKQYCGTNLSNVKEIK